MIGTGDITLAIAAIIPAVILLVKVYKADKLDKEPFGLLLSLVFLGIVSTGIAMFLESMGEEYLTGIYPQGSVEYNLAFYFGVVALSEEGAKYALLRLRTWKSAHFNCQFDGVVYAVFVSLGFALWENIGYVFNYGLSNALLRAFTAVPGHACFGVFMGIWYGMARKYENKKKHFNSKLCRIFAILFSVVMHGFYDFATTDSMENSSLIFIGFIIIMFFVAFKLVKKASAEDRFIRRRTTTYNIQNNR